MSHGHEDSIPFDVKNAFEEADKYFPTEIQKFQFFDKYSRFNYEKGRRETWIETVDRAVDFLKELSQNKLTPQEYIRIRRFILEMKATPSMRLLAMAGPAARRDHTTIYNCSYLPMDSIDSLVEELFIAMAGTGVGYSVEKKYVDNFPIVKSYQGKHSGSHVIEDSTEGWAAAFRLGLEKWFDGGDISFDYSTIRKAGVPLRTKGGRASGPEPLENLLNFTRTVILKRQNKKMRPVDIHDIATKIGECVVSGAVRRSALIALFDMDDKEMMECKNGDNIIGNEQRWNANNSAVWQKEPSQRELLDHMYEMIKGDRGEPGIFSRYAANEMKPIRRKESDFGTNPCGEINLRPYEFCNLSIAIARPDDDINLLKEKVEIATIIGTIQSTATYFPYLRDIWKKNCEEERLLGVDITGQLDCKILHPDNPDLPKIFEELRSCAVETNNKYSKMLGINQSVSVTCVKPSGNSAQMFNCASGLHARWAPYYIRNIRVNAFVPLYKILKESGVPMDPENGQTVENASTYVVHFPVKSPDGAITRSDRTALEQLEYWLLNKKHWTEHNPSVTISYYPHEVIDIINWINGHINYVGGISFLPASDAKYDQMPYEEITKEEYEKRIAVFPKIAFERLYEYEKEDYTTSSQEIACIGKDSCELDYTAYTPQIVSA